MRFWIGLKRLWAPVEPVRPFDPDEYSIEDLLQMTAELETQVQLLRAKRKLIAQNLRARQENN